VITLDGELESLLAQAMRVAGDAQHPIEPALGQRLIEQVTDAARPLMAQARAFAIVTSPVARRALSRLFKPHLPETPVLSFLEIPDGKPVEVVAVVGNEARMNRVERIAA
jgi:flagellar biosynthesis protein FlhA